LDAGGAQPKSKIEFSSEDVRLVHRWNAHTDTINWVTYTPQLDVLSSCSFDCNVYMWQWKPYADDPEKGYMPKVGSLVLGTDRLWKIKIDKQSQYKTAQDEAEIMLKEVEKVTFEELLQEKTKESEQDRPLI
jgi:hypothetical protein